jgi:hypothetical protein
MLTTTLPLPVSRVELATTYYKAALAAVPAWSVLLDTPTQTQMRPRLVRHVMERLNIQAQLAKLEPALQ